MTAQPIHHGEAGDQLNKRPEAETKESVMTAAALKRAETNDNDRAGTSIVVQVSANPGLVLLDRERFNQFYEAIKEETDRLVPDLTTERGRKEIASLAFKVVKTKTAIDAAGKLLKEEAQATVTKVDAARREIRLKLEALSEEVRKPLTEWEEAETVRVDNCKAMIRHIEECGRGMIGGEPQPFVLLLRELEEKVVIDSTFREFEPEAIRARDVALERVREGMERARQAEADRAELERLRAEAAEREAKELAEAEAKAAAEAEARAKAEALARAARAAEEEKARIEAAAKAAEEGARIAAEAKANEERLAQQKAHDEALAAEKRRADEAEAAREAEARQSALAVAKAAADAEAQRKADEARAADREHRGKVMAAAKQAIMGHGVGEATAKAIVLAIAAGEVPAVTIQF